jgi:PKD repeat protein
MLVIDSQGLRSTATRTITVTAPPAVAGPHASFTVSCISLDCTFTDTSTYDTGSVPQSRLWDFGDTVTLATTNPATHTYPLKTDPFTYTARLTVTDAAGNSSTNVQNVLVAPPATTANCASASCSLILTQAARVTVTLVSHRCLAKNDTVVVTAPVMQTVFSNGCVDTTGVPVSIGGGTLFPAGTALQLSVLSGTLPNTAIAFTPILKVSGDFSQGWTLTFDDGYGGNTEPDFNDLILLVKATP